MTVHVFAAIIRDPSEVAKAAADATSSAGEMVAAVSALIKSCLLNKTAGGVILSEEQASAIIFMMKLLDEKALAAHDAVEDLIELCTEELK